jgi:hypothetical protein
MEKVHYVIIDENDCERKTENFNEARRAFRKGMTVLEFRVVEIYTEQSRITISVQTEMIKM